MSRSTAQRLPPTNPNLPADHPENERWAPPSHIAQTAHVSSVEQYQAMYKRSIDHPDQFWTEQANELIEWSKPFSKVQSGSLVEGNVKWFEDGELNACYNCVDRHVKNGKGNTIAILWEADEQGHVRQVTYNTLLDQVSQFANALKSIGVTKGTTVCVYMPNVPEIIVAMLACARLGAIHSVVFAGFTKDALLDRIVDGKCSVVLTADGYTRGPKYFNMKNVVDDTLTDPGAQAVVKSVIVYRHKGRVNTNMQQGRDHWWHEIIANQSTKCPPVVLKATDPLFILFTSGSTGKPKCLQHAIAGYLTYAACTTKYVFDIHEGDRHACVADVAWVTGHTYIVWGPLALGTTTFLFEGIPTAPTPYRYWEMIDRHRLTTFYTSPTATRTLMKYKTDVIKKTDRSSLRLLGSVGEPINPEAWRWLFNEVGDQSTAFVDTYWQSETGASVIVPFPGATVMKPGSASLPFFGAVPVLLNEQGKVIEGNEVSGLLAISRPWPGFAQTIRGDHERFVKTYLTEYPGFYLTGDSARRDFDGYYWITGRIDDVINVSGQ